VSEDLRRAFDFLAAGDLRGARREPFRFGVAVFDDALPLRHDSNYLLVEADDVDADELADDAGRLDRPAILFPDARVGEGLASDFARRGWFVHRGLVMVRRREAERVIDTSIVAEVDEAALRAPRRAQLADEPWATPDLVEQRLDAKLAVARSVEAQFFAVIVDDQAVSWTDLYLDRETAQVEDVATLTEYRGRGYASAVVARAIEEATRAGCDFVFLVTDADDWPQALYRRLGFDDVGRYVKFFRAFT
jgi:ribosomal protein S18 acetylase RimI-like enzyme